MGSHSIAVSPAHQPDMSANSWSNRVKFIVRYMYDVDNNGVLDKDDFVCLAVKNTLMEGKGAWNPDSFARNQKVMNNLWNQLARVNPTRIFQRPSSSLSRHSLEPLMLTVMDQSDWRSSDTTVSTECLSSLSKLLMKPLVKSAKMET